MVEVLYLLCWQTLVVMTYCSKDVPCICLVAVFLTIDDLGNDIFQSFLLI